MVENWIILSLLAGLASNLYNYLSRFVLRGNEDVTAYSWFNETVRVIVFGAIALWDFNIILTGKNLLILGALGCVEVVSIYIFMKMHAYTHLSISTIISRTRLVWVPLIAFIFIGEKLQMGEYVGIVIIFLGLSVAVSPHKLIVDRGIKYSYLSAIAVAVLNTLMKSASSLASTPVVMVFASLPSMIVFPLIMKNPKKRILTSLKSKPVLKLLSIASNIASMYLFLIALKTGPVSKATALYQSMLIVSILAGIFFLGEREDMWKKLGGGVLTLMGVYVMTFF